MIRQQVISVLNTVDRALRQSHSALSDVHPYFERLSKIPVRYYALAWIWGANLIQSVRYDAPIDPMKIYLVNPRRVDRTVTWTHVSADVKDDEHPRFRPPNYRLAGRVFGGEWDTIDAWVTESTIHQSFEQHFNEGVPWEETGFYEETLTAIENGGTPWQCDSQTDLDERCTYLDDLYDRIARQGYKTQDELHAAGESNTNPHRAYRVIWNEVAVSVGRDGELIFQDGRNRLSIARILEVEAIPVVILVRHKKWQQTRDRIVRGELTPSELPEELRTHPDLVDLFTS